ncbi:hypothetical protein Bhyg_09385 [Pseudolycoriella hygida]|uniref:Uncharacterized protein n=1 Tax=Pseudolycoriella hygida TaxID=35572 RepID=A0A9Q0N6C2_9DIPT|nr:hypothetical protein Bhyg_09385 [Pseudolycoriella hygida]
MENSDSEDRNSGDDLNRKTKYSQAFAEIISVMKRNRIPIPSKYQKSRVDEDLPITPQRREAEILRRFRYLEPGTTARRHIEEKLNDLLVYAEVAKILKSELIAVLVLRAPAIPSPSPEQRQRVLQQREKMRERDRRAANNLRKYQEIGEGRRAALQSVNPFVENVRTVTLPPQTLAPPTSHAEGTARLDLEEQRRRDIENYARYGAIRKRPQSKRDVKVTKLPAHQLSSTSSKAPPARTSYITLQNQRDVDKLYRELNKAIVSQRRILDSDVVTEEITSSDLREQQLLQRTRNIDERNERAANAIQKHQEIGQSRLAAVQSENTYGDNTKTVTLSPQTVTPSTSDAQVARRVEEQRRRRDIEHYAKLGAVRKRLHFHPEYERNLKEAKLPAHQLPSTSSEVLPSRTQSQILENEREIDALNRQLQGSTIIRRRILEDDPDIEEITLPESREQRLQRKRNIEQRNARAANAIQKHHEIGQRRLASVQSVKPFADNIRTVTLPPHTLVPPSSDTQGASRLNLEEQRRKDIENFSKYGAMKRNLYLHPEYDRNLKGAKFPPSQLCPKTSNGKTSYKELERQRRVDILRQQLQAAMVSTRRITKKRHPDDHSKDTN